MDAMEKEIYLAGGCFWGVQRYLSLLYGVTGTQCGYANGGTESATYQEVCSGSGHAETVHVRYDDDILPLTMLLEFFFDVIDPCSLNRQGHDMGVQYRTGIYYVDAGDLEIIEAYIDSIRNRYAGVIVTELLPLASFCAAEEMHQDYLAKNEGGYCHIDACAMERALQTYPNPGK